MAIFKKSGAPRFLHYTEISHRESQGSRETQKAYRRPSEVIPGHTQYHSVPDVLSLHPEQDDSHPCTAVLRMRVWFVRQPTHTRTQASTKAKRGTHHQGRSHVAHPASATGTSGLSRPKGLHPRWHHRCTGMHL